MRIPDKLYFKIGEVARLAGVEPHVLRYWETEFPISPVKSRSKQRLYRKKDVKKVLEIKTLLYGEGYTIEGARKKLKEAPVPRQLSITYSEKKVRQELESILKLLG